MRLFLRSIVAGGAVILAAAGVTQALAREDQVHVLTVRLPGGGVEQIQYKGNIPPRVVLLPERVAAIDPFVALQRISALMDQQAAAMLGQMPMMPGLPPGATGYSFASGMSGNGVCTRSVRITFNGGDTQPKMVSSTSGDCGSDRAATPPSEVNGPAPAAGSRTIEAKAVLPKAVLPSGQPVQEVAWNR